MIKSFKHRGLRQFYVSNDAKLLNPNQVGRIRRLLDALDAAKALEAMNYPSNRLHELRGKREGVWSVRVSGNWRITFQFQDGNAYNVDLEDYH